MPPFESIFAFSNFCQAAWEVLGIFFKLNAAPCSLQGPLAASSQSVVADHSGEIRSIRSGCSPLLPLWMPLFTTKYAAVQSQRDSTLGWFWMISLRLDAIRNCVHDRIDICLACMSRYLTWGGISFATPSTCASWREGCTTCHPWWDVLTPLAQIWACPQSASALFFC